jgi:hypothetical protein
VIPDNTPIVVRGPIYDGGHSHTNRPLYQLSDSAAGQKILEFYLLEILLALKVEARNQNLAIEVNTRNQLSIKELRIQRLT